MFESLIYYFPMRAQHIKIDMTFSNPRFDLMLWNNSYLIFILFVQTFLYQLVYKAINFYRSAYEILPARSRLGWNTSFGPRLAPCFSKGMILGSRTISSIYFNPTEDDWNLTWNGPFFKRAWTFWRMYVVGCTGYTSRCKRERERPTGATTLRNGVQKFL